MSDTLGRVVVNDSAMADGPMDACVAAMGAVDGPDARPASHATQTLLLKRVFDVIVSTVLLLVALPLMLLIAMVIVLESPGPVFYRAPRVGAGGSPLSMLKFRKMSASAAGHRLTTSEDPRFTRIGELLAKTRLDELPQLWHVLTGEMSLVGPRPEDPSFVAVHPAAFAEIHAVRPGLAGLSQLAFAKEARILAAEDPVGDYCARILPQKVALDRLYAESSSLARDVRILIWTFVAVALRRDVAVHRSTGRLTIRRRPAHSALELLVDDAQAARANRARRTRLARVRATFPPRRPFPRTGDLHVDLAPSGDPPREPVTDEVEVVRSEPIREPVSDHVEVRRTEPIREPVSDHVEVPRSEPVREPVT